jgi:hypothetical protein
MQVEGRRGDVQWGSRHASRISYAEEQMNAVGARALALATFASTLELVANHVGLAIEGDAHTILREWAPEEIPADQRLDALS